MRVLGLCATILCGVLIRGTFVYAIDCDTIPPVPAVAVQDSGTFDLDSYDAGDGGCWGWIDPEDEEEYAISTTTDMVHFVRVSTMSIIDQVEALFGWHLRHAVRTYGHYCYACGEYPGTTPWHCEIIDMGFLPDSAHYVKLFESFRTQNLSIDTARGFMYLVQGFGMRVYDLADPVNPAYVGVFSTGGLDEVVAFNDTVYCALGPGAGFSIWDFTDKQNPIELGRVTIPGEGVNVSSAWPTEDRKYLITAESQPGGIVKVWNIQDKSFMYQAGEYAPASGVSFRVQVEGDFAYLSELTGGFSILNIENPECIQEVAHIDATTGPIWDAYPHTAGRRTVYASDLGGYLHVFQTDITPVTFEANQFVGSAPLAIDFAETSPFSESWYWDFGDGGSSILQHPSHTFGPGLYHVSLDITTTIDGTGSTTKQNYITAFAETLKVSDQPIYTGSPVVWNISYHNNVPVTELKLPIQLSNVPSVATLDSINTVGCRTDYFELQEFLLQQYGSGRAVLRLKADDGGGAPALPVGNGPIARIYLTVNGSATSGQQVVLTMPPIGVAQHTRTAYTYTAADTVDLFGGIATVAGACDCSCHGDPNCDGNHDVLDVVHVVGVAFRNVLPEIDPLCPHGGRTDLNCSGDTDVIDVVNIVSIAFRNISAQSIICNPCSP